ncbi:hypothetical protein ERO13_A02G156400v2 [Gossypium hirsutum]|uniref:PR5-like receptor kinase isoform X2 n=1 Tax=Gossypium hirsutum TaxID=3635 RepID=A0A1U8LWW1_GOSHI|nr:PR5-like receptor kinase isoform X2 [Gossypium hirsutum]KAG4212300.1 hypothetical protein ERO13_A02G156400v2 [Gossypium hirsutum]
MNLKPQLPLICLLALIAIVRANDDCPPLRCGNLTIGYPFRLKTQPRNCGDPRLELDCENSTDRTVLIIEQEKFYVQNISYSDYTIRFVDPSLVDTNNCSIPLSSFPLSGSSCDQYMFDPIDYQFMYIVNCMTLMESRVYIDASRCINGSGSSSSQQSHFYFLVGRTPPSEFNPSCTTVARVPGDFRNISGLLTSDVYEKLSKGFEMSWRYYNISCEDDQGFFIVHMLSSFRYGLVIYLESFIHYLFNGPHLASDTQNTPPCEGGYGSVFKGKLRSNLLVAVKLLGKAKTNGQDFISEVATIGRIHHVNVAKLVGFCVEGSKQALVYDFMPNGSLDKIIFSGENKITLTWQKTFEIATGVARGIEYLHRGCDTQILHFDIKPHNILLDENFVPKVSDFGLAKLYSVDDSIVSLTAARGTLGYIAPELVYKNIGGISYKADVYSFGMLLMEMIGKRKNLNEFVEHSSQTYFPSWVYDRFNQGEDIELGDAQLTSTEKTIVTKMIIAAFWCIQMKPIDRPSMSKVLEILDTDIKFLEMPPKPYQLLLESSSSTEDYFTKSTFVDYN